MIEPSLAALQAHADSLLRAGDVTGAIAAHRALLVRAPDRADAWYNLAWLQRTDRKFDDALASYSAALAHGASGREAIHVNRAAILAEHFGRHEQAEAELRDALAADPAYVPAWLNLGLIGEDRGDRDLARCAYDEVARRDPPNGRAAAGLAGIDVVEGRAAQAIDRLRKVAAIPGMTQEDRAEIGFALGNALDATGDYVAAFAAYSRANQVAQSLLHPALRYDRRAQDALVDAIIRTFDGSLAKARPTEGTSPLFICGMFRSGSTLCERLLAAHSRVTAGGELEAVPALVARSLAPYPDSFAQADPDALRAAYSAEIDVLFPRADVLTDKRCDNVFHIGLIKSMFPDSRIVHTHRQALDNILSVYFLYFGDGAPYGFDLDDAVHYYKSYRRVLGHWRGLYGGDVVDFDYDQVVADPRSAMQAVLAGAGLGVEEAALSGQPKPGVVRTPSAWAVRRPVHAGSSSRWRNYSRHIPHVIEGLKDY